MDARVSSLVTYYVDLLNAGKDVDPEQIWREHPDLAAAVVEQLEIFVGCALDPTPEVPLGTLGDYTLRRQIGRGGMGVVYDAWQNSVDRQVALKVLPAGVAADNKAFMRFMREARTAAQLNHRNVVGVYGMGQEENTPYYSMEFVNGQTLAQILPKLRDAEPGTETAFGPKDQGDYFVRLARAFADVAEGLHHAHSKDVIHRDIKPSNLILDQERRLRILDFGLARIVGQESLTVTGDVVGTPLYMSPEQARQRNIEVDHRTDIYSLGATMYEAITGRPPFQGKDHRDTLSQIIERDPVDPRRSNPRVPKDLETIVLKCLRKDASDRYGTAEALAQDLRRFVRADPIEARPQTTWEKSMRFLVRRRRQLASWSLMFALVLGVGVLGYQLYTVSPADSPPGSDLLPGRFVDVVPVEEVNSSFIDVWPVPSADGCELFFASNRPGGKGQTDVWKGQADIWVVSRSSRSESWKTPRPVEELNSPYQELPGWLSLDGLRLYYTTQNGSLDGGITSDIRCAHRRSRSPRARWVCGPPEELAAINSSYGELMVCLTADECEMVFETFRSETRTDADLWTARRPNRAAPWGEPHILEEIHRPAWKGIASWESSPWISSDGLTLFWSLMNRGEIWFATRTSREERFGQPRQLGPPVQKAWEAYFRFSLDWPAPTSMAYFVRATAPGEMAIYQARWRPDPKAPESAGGDERKSDTDGPAGAPPGR